MHTIHKLVVVKILALILLLPAIANEEPPVVPTEAEPFVRLLRAVKNSDAKGLRGAYSARIRDDREQGNWDKNLGQAKVNLAKMFGEYDLADFSFAFFGDKREGGITVMYRGSEKFSIPVILEPDGWKLNER